MVLDNLQEYINKNPPKETVRMQIYDSLKALADIQLIGRSILGRDIHSYKIGRGNKSILYLAAHRGTEYITSALLLKLCVFLLDKATRPTVYSGINSEFLLQKFTFWCVPCVNPDGIELSLSGISDTPLYDRQMRMNNGNTDFSAWQANARGVDLTANYDYAFAERKILEREEGILAGAQHFSGEYPESEPEVRSVCSLVRAVSPSLIISLTEGQKGVSYAPRSNRCASTSSLIAKRLRSDSVYHADITDSTGPIDYTGNILNIPSVSLGVGKGEGDVPYSKLPEIAKEIIPILYSVPTYV